MQFEKKIFRSKISRQIFATFVICALLPVGCLAVLVYFQVSHHLSQQTKNNLHQAVKSHSHALSNRIKTVDQNLRLVSSFIDEGGFIKTQINDELRRVLLNQFKSIMFFSKSNEPLPVLNQLASETIKLEPDDLKHLSAGNPLIMELSAGQSKPSIMILRRSHPKSHMESFIAGEINLNFLWEINQIDNLPMDTEVCILDSSYNFLYSSLSNLSENNNEITTKSQNSISGNFEFLVKRKAYFASYSQMFLKPTYKLRHWTVVLIKAKSDIFAPIDKFKIFFPLFIILTVILVLLLSISNIRKRLVPIAILKEGAERIAQKDFQKKISINSQDEFEELAIAFNDMSNAIEQNFIILDAKAEIDNAVLSTLSREEMIKIAIVHISNLIDCHVCGISLIDFGNTSKGCAFYKLKQDNQLNVSNDIEIKPFECPALNGNSEDLIVHSNDPVPSYLPTLSSTLEMEFIIFPIWVKKELSGVLWIAVKENGHLDKKEIKLLRQLAGQIAVALSNSNLIEKQKEMNWGTLQALARTVDAKSPWTAGHSQRVTEIALKIGNAIHLDSKSIENLHRAALLHDIGKVGVPSAILDKPAKLSDEEFKIIKSHPELGVKIISPIKAFKELIPIVGQHHERFDGKGYPNGIAGEAIDIGARILAVADVYDALASDRPYRKGMSLEKIIDLMQREAGHQFDPFVVDALLQIIRNDNRKAA